MTCHSCTTGGTLYFHGACHRTSPTWCHYNAEKACIIIQCAKCTALIAEVAVAGAATSPADLALAACRSIRFAVKNAERFKGEYNLNDILAADQLARQALGEIRTCRKCGCTDADCSGCIKRTGQPCHWVGKDLCSACAPKRARKGRP